MTIELDLMLRVLPLLISAYAVYVAVRRDQRGDEAKLEQRLRTLEEAMIRLENFVEARKAVPDRLIALEKQADRMNDIMQLLREHLPRLLRDVARGEVRRGGHQS